MDLVCLARSIICLEENTKKNLAFRLQPPAKTVTFLYVFPHVWKGAKKKGDSNTRLGVLVLFVTSQRGHFQS